MPLITAIKRQRRSETTYSIYLDGSYSFSLTDLQLSASDLREGRELDDDEVLVWQQQAQDSKAYNAAMRYVSYRMRSRREIADYLNRKEYPPEQVQQTIEKLADIGLINDVSFARHWIAERNRLKPRSRRVLQQELAAKGVARDAIDLALADEGQTEADTIMMLAEKKRRLPQYQDPVKLMAFLARKGFAYEDIKKALVRLDEL